MLFGLAAVFAAASNAEFSTNPAGTNTPAITRYEQRALYKDAIYFIQTGQLSRYRNIKERLTDYPLYPYLEYMRKIYYISRQDAESILEFVNRYPDTPIARQLLQNWLYSQAKRGRWKTFLRYYSEEVSAPKIDCFNAYALYKTDRLEAAWEAARRLWLVEFSQPDECDHIFRVFRIKDQLTRELAWQRFAMSLASNNVDLANYLMRFLDRDDRQAADNFKMVHLKPYNLQRIALFGDDNARNREIILHGIERLARISPRAAYNAFSEHVKLHDFGEEEAGRAWARIGIFLSLDGDAGNQIEQLPISLSDHPGLVEARIRFALRRQAWGQVLVFINLLPDELQNSPRWQFWKARVLMGSDDLQDRLAAIRIFRALSTQRNYYGFLAADALRRPYHFENNHVQVTPEQILSLEETPGIQRALELFVLNDLTRARREWYFTTRGFSAIEQQIAARVARKWGWYRHAIHSMIAAEAWDDLDLRFPLAYRHTFTVNARTADIPLNWSLAVARQESAFMPDARSSAGALGIMQLMPATASLVAESLGMNSVSVRDLTDPDTNIRLGSAYLGELLRRFDQNRILATAAYNAGPARVERWLNPSLPLDVWIETIPFRETRHYIQNVLMFSTIYARRLEGSHPMIYAREKNDFSRQQFTLNTPLPPLAESTVVSD